MEKQGIDSFKRMILIVEDQEINRIMLGEALKQDFDILCAADGREGLALARRHRETISVMLLDLVMPVMDGYQVITEMKRDPSLSHIPIIVLTGEADAELTTLRMGAANFIPKPFGLPEVIRARVSRIVELAESRKIIQATEKDDLTGLYHEHFFFRYAEQLVRYHPDWEMDALALSLERFSMVGALYGRPFCDRLLQRLAETLLAWQAGAGGIGGLIQSDLIYLFVRRKADYTPLMDDLKAAVRALGENVHLNMCLGVCALDAGSPDENADPAALIQSVFQRARSTSVRQDGDFSACIRYFDDAAHRREIYLERLVADLPRALREEEFQVWYQPKYDLSGGTTRLRSAEALIRWNHPDLGMVPPGDFIPLFERLGLIRDVDLYVWRHAARQLADWKKRFGTGMTLSVNLSRVDVHEPELKNILLGLVAEAGLRPSELHLEITESAYTEDAEQLAGIVGGLRDAGFLIEMDDFGAGYSSLNMLSVLPIDVLKMDMRFMQGLTDHRSRQFRMIGIIADIARALEVPLIAEGVETRQQLDLLQRVGCNIIQGYYFSRPLPADAFEKLLRDESKKAPRGKGGGET